MSQSLGMIETRGFAGAIEATDAMVKAADAALKSASVDLLGWKKAGGGLVAIFFTGDVASAKAALESAVDAASKVGSVESAAVIARPHEDLSKLGCF